MLGARTKRETAAYTVASLADAYKASPQFAELAHRSQIVYGTALRKITDTLGFIPATALERRHVQKVLDGEDFGAGTHNNYIAVLSALYTWARGRDKASQQEEREVSEETFASIIRWGDETFGPAEPKRIIERAYEEWCEMKLACLTGGEAVAIEAADVIIVLLRMPGIAEAIQWKMAVNRARKWKLMGDGTGYHVPAAETARGKRKESGGG